MLRKAGTSDLISVTQLAILLWPDNRFDDLKQEMRKTLLDQKAATFLYLDNDTPVGFAQYQLRHDYVEGTDSSPVGYLEGVFVVESYRNRGIARRLVQKCELWSKEHDCVEFASDCELTNVESHAFHVKLGFEEAKYIFETNTISTAGEAINVDDIAETANHFKCVDMIITQARYALTERLIKEMYLTLMNGTSHSRLERFAVGDYKRMPNEVGGEETTPPEQVGQAMKRLLADYNAVKKKTFEELLGFHVRFEKIHPFQDGNGRVGRLILFKECLRNSIVPFIIDDEMKMFYYRGLYEWDRERGYLTDTCLAAQDKFKQYLRYFRIGH